MATAAEPSAAVSDETAPPDSRQENGAGSSEAPQPAAMSIAEARALIAERHNLAVDENDPILAVVTLHQGFLSDYERLLDRHEKTMTAVLAAESETSVAALQETIAALKDQPLETTFQKIAAEVRLAEGVLTEVKKAGRRMVVGLAALSLVTWLALAAAIVLLLKG